jgi:hypothetical protein
VPPEYPVQSAQPPAQPEYPGYSDQPLEPPFYEDQTAVPPDKIKTSGLAIASLVLGILGIICCVFGFLADIPGLILGIIALKKIKAQPQLLGGKGLAIAGVVLSVIGIVLSIFAIITIAPNLREGWDQAQDLVCQGQLMGIGIALDEYQYDYDGKYPESLDILVEEDYLDDPEILKCLATINQSVRTSYIYRGAGLNCNDLIRPAEIILVYDPQENHDGEFRNVLFADGFVQHFEEDEFLEAVSTDNAIRRELGLPEKPHE